MKPGAQIRGLTARILVAVDEVAFVLDFSSVIFAITIAPLIVYTSIAFAILSSWKRYYALVGIIHRFPYLKYARRALAKA